MRWALLAFAVLVVVTVAMMALTGADLLDRLLDVFRRIAA